MMRATCLGLGALLAAGGCQGSDGASPAVHEHTFPPVSVGAFGETDELCQSWTLENEEPLYVNTVSMTNGGGLHHSNWFFVPEDVFPGPDGTWRCDERNFEQLTAAVSGGVLFAQSTQARQEEQRFPEGAVFEIPPRSRVVGNLHILNASEEPLETSIDLRIHTVEEAEVFLSPMSLSYGDLAIPPNSRSRFETTCDFATPYGAPIDFRFYYVLPHYHDIGAGAVLEAVGMPGGDQTIFERDSAIGEALSETLDPPFDASGASHLRYGCEFVNPRPEEVGWGIGDQEMCIVVAWQDSGYMWHAEVERTEQVGTSEEGVPVHEGDCSTVFVPND